MKFPHPSGNLPLVVYALLATVPIAVIAVLSMWFFGSETIREQLAEDLNAQMAQASRREAQRIRERIDQIAAFGTALSKLDLILHGLIDFERRDAYLPLLFRSLQPPESPRARVTLVDYRGRPVISNTDTGFDPEGANPGQASVSFGADRLRFISPVIYQGQSEGALVIDYTADAFADLFGGVSPGGHMVLVDRDNRVLFSSDEAIVAPGSNWQDESQSNWLAFPHTIAPYDLTVWIRTSLQRHFRPLERIRRIELGVSAVYMAITVVLLAGAALMMAAPLNRLTRQISQIGDIGDLSHRIEETGPLEVQRLARSFNAMIEKLEASSDRERALEGELQQAQKLEAIGHLAGGIAHEINSPSQYINNNLSFLSKAFQRLQPLLAYCADSATRGGDRRMIAEHLDELVAAARLPQLLKHIPSAISDSQEGIDNIARIVQAMKEFAHPGVGPRSLADVNRSLQNTITITRNEWKHVARIETRLDPAVPEIPCRPGELNQAFLNLIVNASHAIEDAHGTAGTGLIRVSSERVGNLIVIRIADNGTGIAEEHRRNVFNPFFTTKAVGRGSGQGLAITYDIVVNKHGGRIFFDTEPGKGTTFTLLLRATDEAEPLSTRELTALTHSKQVRVLQS